MEHHLSIFRPYEREAKHEDQLTRAALIVLKLVPLAHEAFLNLIQAKPLSALPRPRFDMQTEKLVPLGTEVEDQQVSELVSVFLGPHEDLSASIKPDLASERRARYDGVIQYGSDLLIVIESKLYANASEQQALEINTGGLPEAESRYAPVRWQELLDRWWNLTELSVLGLAEAAVLDDFFENAEENFGDLLPYTDLDRCGDNRSRRLRRLKAILEKATGFPAEVRDVWGHAGVKFPTNQVTAFDRASLYIKDDTLVLSIWPAELAPQYKHVYSNSKRAEALIGLTKDPAWQVAANLHLAYWRAAGPQRWYPQRHLDGSSYVRQWVKDFQDGRAGRRPREKLNDPKFRAWLIERNYASEGEMKDLDEWAEKLPMDKFDVRPSIQVTRSWHLANAIARDREDQLVREVRESINQVLAALDEPELKDIKA